MCLEPMITGAFWREVPVGGRDNPTRLTLKACDITFRDVCATYLGG